VDAETRSYLDQVLGALREDFNREFGTLRGEFGTLRGEFGTLRGEFGALREEFGTVPEEFGSLRGEFGTVRGEFSALRQEVRDSAAETRRHFDVVAEDLRHDIRGIAEGVIGLSERVDTLGSGLRTEMDERFAATHAVVRVAFQEVRRDIGDLRARL
jgi:methyl-accepting chemotaxis protein